MYRNPKEGLHMNEMGKRLFQNKEGIHSQYDLLGDYKYLQRSAQSTFERSNYWEKGRTKKNKDNNQYDQRFASIKSTSSGKAGVDY